MNDTTPGKATHSGPASPPRAVHLMTEEDKWRIAVVARVRQASQLSLRDAYLVMLAEYYAVDKPEDPSAPKCRILVPAAERPSFRQFRYWSSRMEAVRRQGDLIVRKRRS